VNIKVITVAIILALACAMVVLPSDASGQTRRRSRKSKPAAKTVAAPTDAAESEEEVEGRRQLDEIAKLSSEQKATLKQAIALIQFATRKVKLGGFAKFFWSDGFGNDIKNDSFAGDGKKAEVAIKECSEFLPDGLMRNALQGSLQALTDAWLLDQAEANNGLVDTRVMNIIDRYHLEDTSLYLLSREVLDIAIGRARVAAQMLDLALTPASASQ
jgi:hypothetical protein